MSGDRYVELVWRCSSCGVKNLGRHKACTGCGNPKDASEQFEMPGPGEALPSVVDPSLLRQAAAGEDWRCRYCGSDERRDSGDCGHCGASQQEGGDAGELPRGVGDPLRHRGASARGQAGHPGSKSAFSRHAWVLIACFGVLSIATCGSVLYLARRPSPAPAAAIVEAAVEIEPAFVDEEATVAATKWEHIVTVERWQILSREGFAEQKPADAFDVRPNGQRVHHTDRVRDGSTTETYTETVPDGFASEPYTATVSCGQSCTTSPRTCTQKCTSQKNGFAKCTDVCTGGNSVCVPKTCTEQRTRQVPRTKVVQRTREVPRYKDVPRMADVLAWKEWGWAVARTVRAEGEGPAVRWPQEKEVALGLGLAKGEREQAKRSAFYRAELMTSRGSQPIVVPDLERFSALHPGDRRRVRVHRHRPIELLEEAPPERPSGAPTPAPAAPSSRPSP
jgi:hypothetical protein